MDANGFYDIYGMWYVPWWQRPLFLWIMGILVGLLILILVAIIIKKLFFPKKPKTPWEVALYLLAQAHEMIDSQKTDAAQFYAQITSILKGYLITRYHYDVAARTDIELIDFMQRQTEFPAQLLPLLTGLLQRAEMAKFAKVQAILDQIHEDYAISCQIVRLTIPAEKKEKKS